MGETGLARLVKLGIKTSTLELNIFKVVDQKSESVINKELFVVIFLGILQNYFKII